MKVLSIQVRPDRYSASHKPQILASPRSHGDSAIVLASAVETSSFSFFQRPTYVIRAAVSELSQRHRGASAAAKTD